MADVTIHDKDDGNDLTAPSKTDGPQEPVDDSELEEEQHPTVPDEDD